MMKCDKCGAPVKYREQHQIGPEGQPHIALMLLSESKCETKKQVFEALLIECRISAKYNPPKGHDGYWRDRYEKANGI